MHNEKNTQRRQSLSLSQRCLFWQFWCHRLAGLECWSPPSLFVAKRWFPLILFQKYCAFHPTTEWVQGKERIGFRLYLVQRWPSPEYQHLADIQMERLSVHGMCLSFHHAQHKCYHIKSWWRLLNHPLYCHFTVHFNYFSFILVLIGILSIMSEDTQHLHLHLLLS